MNSSSEHHIAQLVAGAFHLQQAASDRGGKSWCPHLLKQLLMRHHPWQGTVYLGDEGSGHHQCLFARTLEHKAQQRDVYKKIYKKVGTTKGGVGLRTRVVDGKSL